MLLRPSRRKCLITFWVGIYFQTLFWTKIQYFLRAIRKRSANTSFSRLIKITFSFNFENLAKIFSKHRFVGFQFGREISKLRVIFFYSYWTRGIEHFLKKKQYFSYIFDFFILVTKDLVTVVSHDEANQDCIWASDCAAYSSTNLQFFA